MRTVKAISLLGFFVIALQLWAKLSPESYRAVPLSSFFFLTPAVVCTFYLHSLSGRAATARGWTFSDPQFWMILVGLAFVSFFAAGLVNTAIAGLGLR